MKNVVVRRFRLADREAWEELARGYKQFYNTVVDDAGYEHVWSRLIEQREVYGFCAECDGQVKGIVHYLFHTTVWEPRACYLQDLYTASEARGMGVGRALIEAVAAHAKEDDCDRLYWNTQEHNESARLLYDKIAEFKGFIRYDYPVKTG